MYRFVILFLVMASVAGGLGYFQENRWEASAVERSDRQARLLAREVAQEVGRPVEVNARVIEALAKLVEIQGDLSSNVLQLMVSAQRAPFVPFSSVMYIANADGISVAYDPPFDKFGTPNVGTDYRDRDYYQEFVRTGGSGPAFIGPVRMGRRAHAPNVQTAAAAHDGQGRFWAFTQGSIDLATLRPQVEQLLSSAPHFRVVALSKGGNVFIHPDKNAIEEMRDLSNYPFFKAPENSDGEIRSGLDETGEKIRGAVVPILQRGINWRVAVFQPQKLIDAQVGEAKRKMWTVLGAGLAMGLVLTGLFFPRIGSINRR